MSDYWQPLVTCVIPTYRAGELLTEAIRSVQVQSLRPDEIVVVDDASPDDTYQLACDLASSSEIPIRVFRLDKNSGGPCRPMNYGIARAKGEVIIILEQDDRMPEQRIARQLAALRREPSAALVIGRYEILNRDSVENLPEVYERPQFQVLGELVNEMPEDSVRIEASIAFAALLHHNFTISNSNFCFKRSTWESIGGYDENIATVADLDFALRSCTIGPIAICDSVTLLYTFAANSLNRRNPELVRTEGLFVRMRAIESRPQWGASYFWARWSPLSQKLKSSMRRLQLGVSIRILWSMHRSKSLAAYGAVKRSTHSIKITSQPDRNL